MELNDRKDIEDSGQENFGSRIMKQWRRSFVLLVCALVIKEVPGHKDLSSIEELHHFLQQIGMVSYPPETIPNSVILNFRCAIKKYKYLIA